MPATDDQAVPPFLSSLPQRTRTALLVLLLVVLPLQSLAQIVHGFQGHRHVHTGAVQSHSTFLTELAQPVRALLDRLHADQDPRLQSPGFGWAISQGDTDGWHTHGGVRHKHSQAAADVIDVGETADDAMQGGATAFLAWLPVALAVPMASGGVRPAVADFDWRDCVVTPPLTPPRG